MPTPGVPSRGYTRGFPKCSTTVFPQNFPIKGPSSGSFPASRLSPARAPPGVQSRWSPPGGSQNGCAPAGPYHGVHTRCFLQESHPKFPLQGPFVGVLRGPIPVVPYSGSTLTLPSSDPFRKAHLGVNFGCRHRQSHSKECSRGYRIGVTQVVPHKCSTPGVPTWRSIPRVPVKGSPRGTPHEAPVVPPQGATQVFLGDRRRDFCKGDDLQRSSRRGTL